ncbi:MAG: hypothetical protein LBU58_00315, partial [Clostridiales bacterium]|nr:hypothetical protein [Clostridiales bacterium]
MMDDKKIGQPEIQQSLTANLGKEQSLTAQSDSKVYESIRLCLADARTNAFNAINTAMVGAYWEIGRQI